MHEGENLHIHTASKKRFKKRKLNKYIQPHSDKTLRVCEKCYSIFLQMKILNKHISLQTCLKHNVFKESVQGFSEKGDLIRRMHVGNLMPLMNDLNKFDRLIICIKF